ncbi:hypothetical protein [Metaclostridioides mangenotii]|uniref:Uncharacterized protein n=1 Tax=Metaclostridioides mangenotii TaxID=1540 RepID=A0ABS4EBX5_9FIRM|nr:hypothetical protein [Clostridioides mangenotii]MBP1855435.1 hypothetical protein [Clostridioides mangenotii]
MYNNIYEIVFDKKAIEKIWITSLCLKNCDTDEVIANTKVAPQVLKFQQIQPCLKI